MTVYVTHDTGVREVFLPAAYMAEHQAVVAKCDTCGRSWDDSLSTAWTPAPSGRCPFEYEHKPERIYPVTGEYDLDLRSSGDGWMGTWSGIIRHTIDDITQEGDYSPVEITTFDGTVTTGTLLACPPDEQRFTTDGLQVGLDALVIDARGIPIDDIARFRA